MDLIKITEMIGKLGVDAKESFIYFLWINFSLEIIQYFLWGLFLILFYKAILSLMIYISSANRYLVAINDILEVIEQETIHNDGPYFICNKTIKAMLKKIKIIKG